MGSGRDATCHLQHVYSALNQAFAPRCLSPVGAPAHSRFHTATGPVKSRSTAFGMNPLFSLPISFQQQENARLSLVRQLRLRYLTLQLRLQSPGGHPFLRFLSTLLCPIDQGHDRIIAGMHRSAWRSRVHSQRSSRRSLFAEAFVNQYLYFYAPVLGASLCRLIRGRRV